MKTIYYIVLIVAFGIIVSVSICMPNALIFNSFLIGFINHEILSTQGVILAITLASIANLHIAFNKIEEDFGEGKLAGARAEIRQNAYGLVFAFVASVIVVFVWPYFVSQPIMHSMLYGIALWLLLLSVIILVDIMDTVFSLPPLRSRGKSKNHGQDE